MTDNRTTRREGACECTSPSGHLGKRVVLTGGPGAGKTAVLEVVRRHLCVHVQVLPEAASIVFGGGFPRIAGPPGQRAAQLAIYQVQRQLEAVALARGPAALVVCDRGVLDALAYWPDTAESFLREAGTTRAEALARYDAVIHLRTPRADGGYNHQNPLRVESTAEAEAIDRRLDEAWEGHPRRFVVRSEAHFLDKLAHTLMLLQDELPACCRPALVLPSSAE